MGIGEQGGKDRHLLLRMVQRAAEVLTNFLGDAELKSIT